MNKNEKKEKDKNLEFLLYCLVSVVLAGIALVRLHGINVQLQA